MTGKTHQIIGASASLTYYLSATTIAYNPATLGAVLVFGYIGSLLPDIDQSSGKLWNHLPFGKTISKIPTKLLKHRNITHSLLGVALVSVGFYYLFRSFPDYWGINTNTVFICTMIAYLSHLIADMITVEGIPLFFPYKRFFGLPPKPFQGFRVMTGKWFENLVIFPAFTIYFIILIIANWENIKKLILK